MNRLRTFLSKSAEVFRRRKRDRDLDDEIQAHLDEAEEELRSRGMTSDEARRTARLEFGHVASVREVHRERRGFALLDRLWVDTSLALRRLRAHPFGSLGAILTLAGSMAAAATAWLLISATLLSPLSVRDPASLVEVGIRTSKSGPTGVMTGLVFTSYEQIRSSGAFESLAAGGSWRELVESDGIPTPRDVFFANHEFFDTLGVIPAYGREFVDADDQVGAPLTGLLSDRLARALFGSGAAALGRTIAVSGRPTAIVGVLPATFRGLDLSRSPDLYMPLHTIVEAAPSLRNPFALSGTNYSPTAWVRVVGRKRSGMSDADAQARLRQTSVSNKPIDFELVDLVSAAVPAAARTNLTHFARLLMAAVVMLIGIGCLSVGMLLLVRTEARRSEFGMCLALGATRARLARGVVLEGAVLALLGAILSLPLVRALTVVISQYELPGAIRVENLNLAVDIRVFGVVMVAAVLATLAIAVMAGALGFRAQVQDALRAGPRGVSRGVSHRARTILVVAEVAVTLFLAYGSGLLLRSLSNALALNSGFETDRLVTGNVSLAQYGYTPDQAKAFFDALQMKLASTSLTQSVARSSWEGGMGTQGQLSIDGEKRVVPSLLSFTGVDEHYFPTIGLRVLQGRNFQTGDGPGGPLVAIVSQSLARFVSGDASPIGHRIAQPWSKPGRGPDVLEIVGVVPDVVTNLAALQPLELYMPLAQRPLAASSTFVVKAIDDPAAVATLVASMVKAVDSRVTVLPFRSMDEALLAQMRPQRFAITVLSALGAVAMLLTVMGTAVMAEAIAMTRRKELGIRAALGASSSRLRRELVSQTLVSASIGIGFGLGLSWLGAETVRALLFRVELLDIQTLTVVVAGLLFSAGGVALIPAVRASRPDLAKVLRED